MDIVESIREEGIQKELKEGQKQIILNMLKKKADISFMLKVTGLPEKEIKKLKSEAN